MMNAADIQTDPCILLPIIKALKEGIHFPSLNELSKMKLPTMTYSTGMQLEILRDKELLIL